MKKLEDLQSYLLDNNFSQIFVLTDENTSKYCLPVVVEKVDEISDRQATLLEICSGEKYKNIDTVIDIINSLSESNADRKSCLISLGGGVVTDIGGFVSSIYKRGLQNINIPTTLLSMIDAAIGGKTAINYNGIKNLIGTFNFASEVFTDVTFLTTLDKKHIFDGISEMLKTFLVCDETYVDKILSLNDFTEIDNNLIFKCSEIKERIVKQDTYDKSIRKQLNFGHTLGHAIESYYNLSHGHAIAIGMYYTLIFSEKYCNFPQQKLKKIHSFLEKNYDIIDIKKDIANLIPLMKQDKKNNNGKICFILLSDIGKPVFDINIDL